MLRIISRKILIFHLAFWLIITLSFSSNVYAINLDNRFIKIGDSATSAVTSHEIGFTYSSTGVVGSLKFEYCSNSPLFEDVCVPPSGLDLGSVTLVNQTGETGFSIDGSSNASTIILTRIPSATAQVPSTYKFDGAINPSITNVSTFVRVSTYSSTDATGIMTDRGAVIFSTANRLVVGGFVPPYITFCVGITVTQKCSDSTGNYIDLGQLSASTAKVATSQMSVATNDPTGYYVSLHGRSLTSGNKEIRAINSPSISLPGTSQFGINLRANNNPAVGSEPSGSPDGTVGANYNIINKFYFESNSNVAGSLYPTDFTRYTVSYLVNIPQNQPQGIYSATSNFIAVAAF